MPSAIRVQAVHVYPMYFALLCTTVTGLSSLYRYESISPDSCRKTAKDLHTFVILWPFQGDGANSHENVFEGRKGIGGNLSGVQTHRRYPKGTGWKSAGFADRKGCYPWIKTACQIVWGCFAV